MRKNLGWISLVVVFLAACDNEAKIKVDLDSVGKKFDTAAERIWDSTKAKAKDLGERIENRLDGDSTNR
ncbi:MAG TPA: hypothetical protein VFR58_00765 [Flavisolibacter sp.]|nr:hypothetical protein [Flavisolibacter sp.]